MTNVNALIEGAKVLGLELNKKETDKFISYKSLLKEWNEKINITSITDDLEIDIKHFIDSLTVFNTNLFKENIKLIDIGTGGGFPGIPLKIMRNDIEVSLLDSTMKKN